MAKMPACHTVSADATVSENWSMSSGHGSEAHGKDGGQQRRLGRLRHPGMCLLGLILPKTTLGADQEPQPQRHSSFSQVSISWFQL